MFVERVNDGWGLDENEKQIWEGQGLRYFWERRGRGGGEGGSGESVDLGRDGARSHKTPQRPLSQGWGETQGTG